MIVSDAELADKDNSDQTILELEAKLEDAIQKLSMLQELTDKKGDFLSLEENGEALSKLEDELASAEGTIVQLQSKILDQEALPKRIWLVRFMMFADIPTLSSTVLWISSALV